MKYLKSYKNKEKYVDDIRGGGNTHSIPNVALIEDDNEKTYYDIERMSDNKSKDIWDRIKEKGWNYNTTSAITIQELALITSDEFNSLNETEWQNRSLVWKGLKTFDEFKYFTGVDNINAEKKDSNGNRIGGFDGAKYLESITLPNSLKVIGDFAFNMYTHSGNTEIMDTKLKHVYGGENVEKIGSYAFQNCSGLTELNFSDNLKEIGEYAFAYCYGLVHLSVGKNIEKIGSYAFGECSALTELNFGDKLKEIGAAAFAYLPSLATLKLGKFEVSGFINKQPDNLFTNDTSLKDIYITSDSPSLSFVESQCVLSKIANNVTIHFGEELYTYNGSSWIKS